MKAVRLIQSTLGPRLLRRATALAFVAALVVSPLYPAGATPTSATSNQQVATQKVLVDADDDATRQQLAAQGAELLVDYGAFSLWRLPASSQPSLQAAPSLTPRPDFDTIVLRGGVVVDTHPGAAAAAVPSSLRQTRVSSGQFWLVQFVGPALDEWFKPLFGFGLEVVSYLPHNAYVVWGDGAGLARLDAWAAKNPVVQWTGPYHPAYRLAPSLQGAGASDGLVNATVQLYTTAAVEQSLASLLALGGQVRKAPERILNFTNVTLQLPAGALAEVAAWPDAFNVEPWSAPVRLDEGQGQLVAGNFISSGGKIVPSGPGYLAWLASEGFTTTAAAYPTIDIVDDGIDNGSTNPLHPDFHVLGVLTNTSRLIYNQDCTTDPLADGGGGHGNINAGIVGAYNNLSGAPHVDAAGLRLGLGLSPYGRLAGTKIFRNSGPYNVSACGNSDTGVVGASYTAGATITSNSWGAPVGGAYDASSQAYDALTRDATGSVVGNQEMLHIFAAGNDGVNGAANTIGSPGTAKNVLTVGATEGVRDNGVQDGCGLSAADNADDLASFSSRGPTDDSRTKPDLMAPGTHIQGPASQSPNYDGTGVCGVFESDYYPAGQTLYTWSSGTSHSTPAIAGAASLAYEYYGRVLNPSETPSLAMLKALLVNSSRYLIGLNTGGTLPSQTQGWGGANLGTLFDGLPRTLLDQSLVLGGTGGIYTATGEIISTAQPFRVTLVWTDAPGSTVGPAYVNDLNLRVKAGGVTYFGNVFSGGTSVSGGSFDPRNNIENVFLPAGVSGPFQVEVIAANLAGDGLPGNGDATDQDFALVVYNAGQDPVAILDVAATTVTDAAGDGDGIVEPGETVALDIALANAGTLTATKVSGVLSVTSGSASLTAPSAAYPDVAPGATATNTTPFLAAVSAGQPCGEPLTFDLSASYNVTSTLQHNFEVPVGQASTTLVESFDGVTAPALPAGWSATTLTVTVPAWRTTMSNTDTAPNSVFALSPGFVNDNILMTPPISVTTAAARLSFQHRYDLETAAGMGFDGTVLEIKIGGAVFTDVITAGGQFVTGGYDKVISSSFMNPLAGRMAWTGPSSSYKETSVILPASAAGQTVQLRWRLGTDSSVTKPGHWIDSVVLIDGYNCFTGTFETEVAFSAGSYSVNETAGSVTIAAALNASTSETVTVQYATSPNSANAGSDYTPVTGTLTFAPGVLSAAFNVPILQDILVEGDEALTLTLSSAVNADLGALNPVPLTIIDNDHAGLTLTPPAAGRSGEAGALVTYTLALTNTGNLTDTFTVNFVGGTFTATLLLNMGPLAVGQGTAFNVVVHVPPDAAPGTQSVSTVSVASQADAEQTASTTITTTVVVEHRTYLPLILR